MTLFQRLCDLLRPEEDDIDLAVRHQKEADEIRRVYQAAPDYHRDPVLPPLDIGFLKAHSHPVSVEAEEEIPAGAKECFPLKLAYDQCFQQWFRYTAVRGGIDEAHSLPCDSMWTDYQRCLKDKLPPLTGIENQKIFGGSAEGRAEEEE